MDSCRRCYARYYKKELVSLYDLAVEKNIATQRRVEKIYYNGLAQITNFIEEIRDEKNIYIFGTGMYGKLMYSFLKNKDILIRGHIISEGHKKEKLDLPVYYMSEIDISDSTLILAVKEKTQQDISEMLQGIKTVRVNESLLLFLRRQ